jgi:glycosyl transferase family 87
VTVLLLGKLPGARPWVLALAPALALYVVLNWDLVAIALTIGALLLFHRNRDGWAGLLLALAVWTKFFPVLALPLLLLMRIREGRRREAALLAGVFVLVGIALNAPVAFQVSAHGGGLGVRQSWEYFFTFNRDRPPEINLWTLGGGVHHAAHWTLHQRTVQQLVQGARPSNLTAPQINELSAGLVVAGLVAIGALLWRAVPQVGIQALAPALLATLAWFFFLNKVYSPQYGLWIVVMLALAGAPIRLIAGFFAVDLVWFLATFGTLAANTLAVQQIYHAADLRELMILVVIGWAVRRLVVGENEMPKGVVSSRGSSATTGPT